LPVRVLRLSKRWAKRACGLQNRTGKSACATFPAIRQAAAIQKK
jgi:hypothetical protein